MSELKVVKRGRKKKEPAKYFENVLKDQPTAVTYSETATVNIGNYESVKVMYSISLPTTIDHANQTILEAKNYIHSLINDRVEEIKNEI